MRRIALLLLLTAACSRGEQASSGPEVMAGESPAPVSASSGPASYESEVVGGDEAALREFISRALTYHYPGATGGTTVLVGGLPENLGFELPVPEDSRVIGSIVRGTLQGGTEIILDVDLAPEEALAFYREQLLQAGWEEQTQQAYGGGFGFVSGSWPNTTFCLEENEAAIFLSAYAPPSLPTELRLNIQQEAQYSYCLPQQEGMDEASRLIPALESPPGSLIQSGSGSSGEGMAESSAVLTAEFSTAALAEQYAAQLLEAGWKPLAQDEEPELAWSFWSAADAEGQDWSGLLLIFKSPIVPEKVFASFRVDRGD
ncbi:MAG TPA: hypothetical protein VI729_03875 [Anaerolineales bacterium]|nr:hypothetical protein [Anaerolineales bacterium]